MHELSTMMRLTDIAVRTARDHGADRITRIEVDVGDMTGIVPEWLDRYFPEASKGTEAEGAQLVIHSVPVTVKCRSCGKIYTPDRKYNRSCPACGSSDASLISGRELKVRSVEISEEAPS